MSLRGEECEAHAATDDERVDAFEQRVDHTELVGDLRAAEHGDEGPGGVFAQAQQDVDLFGQQPPGSRRQELRRTDDRRVSTMRRSERIVDVRVEALDQRLHERRIVALLTRIEAEVVEQLDTGRELGEAAPDRFD